MRDLMTRVPKYLERATAVERFMLGMLAVLFMSTMIVGFWVPSESLRFVPPVPSPTVNAGPAIGANPGRRVAIFRVHTTRRLRELFVASAFDLDQIRQGDADVPTLFLASLPGNLDAVQSVTERKNIFIRIALPLILHRNAVVYEQRRRLQRLDGLATAALSSVDRDWLVRLAQLYRVLRPGDGASQLTLTARAQLLNRVDGVPVSLALAQAATESGWGTSRFAQQGNALFGQWTWDESAGLVPTDREEGGAYAVRAFPQLAGSVRAYVHNLNISQHYASFRSTRAALRRAGPLERQWGHILAGQLGAYSVEGADYIEKIRSIIRVNNFGDFETARIVDHRIFTPVPTPVAGS
jgi:Bax protein